MLKAMLKMQLDWLKLLFLYVHKVLVVVEDWLVGQLLKVKPEVLPALENI